MPPMHRTQIYLTREQEKGLDLLARRTGRTRSAVIRDAIDRTLAAPPEDDWRTAWRQARGIWAGRPEVEDDIREMRDQIRARMERLWPDES